MDNGATGNENCTSAFKPTHAPHTPAHSSPHIVSYLDATLEQSYLNYLTRATTPMTKRNMKAKATMKKHADQRARASELHVGDVVLVKQPKLNKISSRYNRSPWSQHATPKAHQSRETPHTSNTYQTWPWRTSCRSCHQNLTFRNLPKPQPAKTQRWRQSLALAYLPQSIHHPRHDSREP